MTEQRSPEWFAERLGKATASRIADVVARTRNGWGASRANYAAQLVAERLTGVPAVLYENAEMRWGTEQEPTARAAYAFYRDVEVEEVGFIAHPLIEMAGASPDGLIGAKGLIEIKCPGTAKHISTLLGEPIDERYYLQMQWQMACTGRDWCDYVSFDPRMPERMRLTIQRVEREDEPIRQLEREVQAFLGEIAQTIQQLKTTYGEAA